MKRFKLIDELQQQMELDIFGKSAREVSKNFLPIEIKALLMTEHHPTPMLIDNLNRLMHEFLRVEWYEYCIPLRDFLNKHKT